jgi:hypothetical protein
MRFATLILLLAGASVTADTEIHRCLLQDGTIAFQEMPCPEPAVDASKESDSSESPGDSETPTADDGAPNFANPFDEPANPPTAAEITLSDSVSKDRGECEKSTRDAIDAIDLEMRETPHSKAQSQEYLVELLELTQQLRACKQL